jgi:hypothetical protein
MITRTLIALTTATALTVAFAPAASAQTGSKIKSAEQSRSVMPFTEAERLLFQRAEGPEWN